MTELLKELILNGQTESLFTGTHRQLKISQVGKKATIIIGVRRCGKSTFINQVANRLQTKGLAVENFLYLNFSDDRLSNLRTLGLDTVLHAYYLLYPEKKAKEMLYCFFDEIQEFEGWEMFIDRILRTENCLVFLTGSSDRMLSKEIATQMRGRALSWELFPFSFQEFLEHNSIKSTPPFNSRQRFQIEKAFEDYFESGGFPEVFSVEKQIRIKIHQEYLESILFRDLIERHNISHPRALIDLARKLMDNIASMYTLNSLTGLLKSLGHNVPKTSISDYLMWMEDCYFLFTVRLFDASYRRSNANPKKIYCIDHSLVRSVSSGILTNTGHLLENLVFTALRARYSEIFYYKTRSNLEIDFVIRTDTAEIALLQVSESLLNPLTRQREVKALQSGMAELAIQKGTIITRNEEEVIQIANGTIHVVPVWKFLLATNNIV
jgi:predicted AAA+ superfamily ATPase